MWGYIVSGGQTYLRPRNSPVMRRLRGDSRGLSEIVGTLMLVLIVIGAAVALGAFVASYEKLLLKQEATTHARALESLTVFAASIPEGAFLDGNPPTPWGLVVFTLASTSVESSSITGMLIDALPILWACALPIDTIVAATDNCGTLGGQWISSGTLFSVPSLSEYEIVANLNDQTGFLNPYKYNALNNTPVGAAAPGVSVPLVIQVFTAYSNTFSGKYLSPIAIGAVVSITIPGTTSVVTALDGEASVQPGNDSIYAWEWIMDDTGPSSLLTTYGTGAIYQWSPIAGDTYDITLAVIDGVGLFNSETFVWTAPASS